MKPLSQMLEEIEPVELPSGKFVHKAEYLKLKQVAIELAKCVEYFEIRHDSRCDILYVDRPCSCGNSKFAEQTISRAKDIIGGG